MRDVRDVTVLMTGAGAPGASGIVRSLRGNDERDVRIVGVDVDPDAYGFALVDEHYTVPAGTDEEYLPEVNEIAALCGVDVLLPLTTAELGPLSSHGAAFERDGVAVMVAEPGPLRIANDKGRLYEFVEEHDIDAAPRFRRASTADEFVDAVSALGYPEEPVCFKRPVASGMRGFRILDDSADRLDRLLHQKPDSSVTTLSDVLPVLETADPFPEFVVMEYLPGDEYSVDVVAMGDSVGPVVPRSRERTRAGISFSGTVEREETLIERATEICTSIGLEYNVNLQFKHDAEGTPKLIEINPRVSGTIIMCVGAGANMPYLGVKYALGEELPPVDVAWGTRMNRYWQETFRGPDGARFSVPEAGEPGLIRQ